MVVIYMSNKTFETLVNKLRAQYPEIALQEGDMFYWSPKDQTVYYSLQKNDEVARWSLLHEVSHGLLKHKHYTSDFELLQLEVEAWEKAKQLSEDYNIQIHEDHIQDCLDTYREWLHARSKCPTCSSRGIQVDPKKYECTQCHDAWQVSTARFCRPYRMKMDKVRASKFVKN